MKARLLLVSSLLLAGCTSTPLAKSRVVSLHHGKVYLGSTGPFTKASNNRYVCPDPRGVSVYSVHSLSRQPGHGWVYTYGGVAMYAEPVDGRVLD